MRTASPMTWAFDLGVALLALALAAVVHRLLAGGVPVSAPPPCPPSFGSQRPQSAPPVAPDGVTEQEIKRAPSIPSIPVTAGSASRSGLATAPAGLAARQRSRPSSEQLRADRSDFLRRIEASAVAANPTKPTPNPTKSTPVLQSTAEASEQRIGVGAPISWARFCERGTEKGLWLTSAPCPDVLEW